MNDLGLSKLANGLGSIFSSGDVVSIILVSLSCFVLLFCMVCFIVLSIYHIYRMNKKPPRGTDSHDD